MKLNIRELLDGYPVRLRYVFRYSTTRVQAPESVAEHSYFVALYCLFIGRWVLEQEDGTIETSGSGFVADLLQRALLHDMEEARSGDFPRGFKHSNLDLKEMLETASMHAMEQVIEPILGHINCGNPLAAEFVICWQTSKDETVQGRILEFADFLSVLSFMMQEGAGNGNVLIKRHVADMRGYFERFGEKSYDFIRPLVEQADVIMREVF